MSKRGECNGAAALLLPQPMAIMAPAKTPAPIIARMNKEIVDILNQPQTKEKLQTAYMEGIGSTPEELTQWMIEERTRWTPVIKHVGLKAD